MEYVGSTRLKPTYVWEMLLLDKKGLLYIVSAHLNWLGEAYGVSLDGQCTHFGPAANPEATTRLDGSTHFKGGHLANTEWANTI